MASEQRDPSTLFEKVDTTECPHCRDDIHVGELDAFTAAECPHCGKTLTVPAKLGPFLLVGVIGTGGMGGVYRAVDQSLGRAVAIKVMLSSLGDDEDFVETFRREAQAAAKLNHPHIAQIYSFGQEKGQPYIVMELVPGRGLDKLIDSGKPLDQGLIVQIGLDIAEGLNEADQIGLLHGDIKPENILLDEKLNGKLVDFGIASYGGQQTSEGIWGTPYYIAPEKLRRQTLDARSDIYSLGATLYHAIAGRPPFEGETPMEVVRARLEHEPPPLHEVREDVDEQIEHIISRMLRMDPAARYPNYPSLIRDMRKVIDKLKPDREAGLKSKKIRVRKKSSGRITLPGSSSTTTGSRPTVVSKGSVGSGGKKELSEEDKAWRKAVKKRLIWAAVLLVLIAAGSGVALMRKKRRDATIAARRQWFALTEARKNVEQAYAGIEEAVTHIVERAEAVDGILAKVFDAVEVVTQAPAADLSQWLERESPRFDPAAVDAEESTPEEVETQPPPAAAATNEPPPAAADGAEPSTNAAVAADANAVADEAPNTTNEGEVAVSDVPEEAPPPEPEAIPEEAPPENEPEIRILAREALAQVLKVRTQVVEARETGARAQRARKEAMDSDNPSFVQSLATTLNDMLDTMEDREDAIRDAIDHAHSIVKKMIVTKTRTLLNRQREEQARIEQEEARRAQQEAEQRQEAYQAKMERERASVQVAAQEVKPLLNQYEYAAAVRTLSRLENDLETEEAKAELKMYVDRYTYLREMKTFFIQQLQDNPFKWGWIQGQSPEDILGANIRFVRLRGRVIPWKEISTRQMVHFIRHYVTRTNREVPLSDLGKHALAAAIFAYEHGGYQWAADFKEQAVQFSPRLRRDAERLVPDAPPPEAAEED